jgi:hypothetical protein
LKKATAGAEGTKRKKADMKGQEKWKKKNTTDGGQNGKRNTVYLFICSSETSIVVLVHIILGLATQQHCRK